MRDKRTPNTDGLMVASVTPRLAGPHVQSVTLVNAGGLKATYFTEKDFTGAALGSNGWRRWPHHEPKWCAPEALSPCDSTKLEGPIDLDFGGFAHPGGHAILRRHAGEDVSAVFRGRQAGEGRRYAHSDAATRTRCWGTMRMHLSRECRAERARSLSLLSAPHRSTRCGTP